MSERQQTWDASMAAQDFRFYRQSLEHPHHTQSMETEGIIDEATFALAMANPSTVRLTVETDGEPRTLPLLMPLESAGEQWNRGFFNTYAPGMAPTHYSHIPLVFRRHPHAYMEALRPGMEQVARAGGVLLLDHADAKATTVDLELRVVARQLGIALTDVSGPEGAVTSHFHYASASKLQTEIDPAAKPTSLYDAFNTLPDTLSDRDVQVQPTLTAAETEQIWEFYEPVFGQLSAEDPVLAGFNYDELTEIAASPKYIKYVYREGKNIANMCLLVDVRECPWMNQNFYRAEYPEQYEQGLVFCSPGVLTNPNLGTVAASLRTMNMVGKTIARAGIEPVITFACDTTSNQQIPRLSHRALNKAGVQVDLLKPASQQAFRMLKVMA